MQHFWSALRNAAPAAAPAGSGRSSRCSTFEGPSEVLHRLFRPLPSGRSSRRRRRRRRLTRDGGGESSSSSNSSSISNSRSRSRRTSASIRTNSSASSPLHNVQTGLIHFVVHGHSCKQRQSQRVRDCGCENERATALAQGANRLSRERRRT